MKNWEMKIIDLIASMVAEGNKTGSYNADPITKYINKLLRNKMKNLADEKYKIPTFIALGMVIGLLIANIIIFSFK